jgi:multisubunit Na+/H+ antiporter MnhC subunit
MIHAAAKMTAAIAVAAFSLSAAVAVAIFVATRDHGDLGKNSPDLVCDPLLQLFGIVAWVISFAFSALWLMTHCELFHSPCHLRRHARCLCACLPHAVPRAAGRLQAFLRDPTKWTTWGGGEYLCK